MKGGIRTYIEWTVKERRSEKQSGRKKGKNEETMSRIYMGI